MLKVTSSHADERKAVKCSVGYTKERHILMGTEKQTKTWLWLIPAIY
jgi:hypothetical protein